MPFHCSAQGQFGRTPNPLIFFVRTQIAWKIYGTKFGFNLLERIISQTLPFRLLFHLNYCVHAWKGSSGLFKISQLPNYIKKKGISVASCNKWNFCFDYMWFQDFGFVKETSTQLLELDAYLLFQGASLRHDPGGKETQV